MNKCRIILLVLAVLAIVIAGCTSQPASPPVTARPSSYPPPVTSPVPPTSPIQPFQGDWSLTTMASQGGTFPEPPIANISLYADINDSSFLGFGGCNNYNAPYTLTGTMTQFGYGIIVGPIVSTKKYCIDTSGQENTYLGILQETTAFAGDENHLTFTGDSHNSLVLKRHGP